MPSLAVIHFLGDHYNIFRVATVERLVKSAVRNNKFLTREYIEPRAKAALREYYQLYSERFAVIGDPRRHKLPRLTPGEAGNSDPQVLLPKPQWELVTGPRLVAPSA